MNKLTISTSRPFLDRFWGGSDGVIRNFLITFRYRSQKETKGNITISLKDSQTTTNEGWVNLIFELVDVTEFSFREGPASYQVISSEIHIGQFDGLFFIDFGGCVEQPTNVSEFRKSDFYCACKSILWELKPYQE